MLDIKVIIMIVYLGLCITNYLVATHTEAIDFEVNFLFDFLFLLLSPITIFYSVNIIFIEWFAALREKRDVLFFLNMVLYDTRYENLFNDLSKKDRKNLYELFLIERIDDDENLVSIEDIFANLEGKEIVVLKEGKWTYDKNKADDYINEDSQE